MVVLKTKTDLLNVVQEIEHKIQEELAQEKESHVVDIQNVKSHMASVIEGLEREKKELQAEKEDLAAKLQATTKKFIQADATIKVFG